MLPLTRPGTRNCQLSPGCCLRCSSFPSPGSLGIDLARLSCPRFQTLPSAHWPRPVHCTCCHKNPVVLSLNRFDGQGEDSGASPPRRCLRLWSAGSGKRLLTRPPWLLRCGHAVTEATNVYPLPACALICHTCRCGRHLPLLVANTQPSQEGPFSLQKLTPLPSLQCPASHSPASPARPAQSKPPRAVWASAWSGGMGVVPTAHRPLLHPWWVFPPLKLGESTPQGHTQGSYSELTFLLLQPSPWHLSLLHSLCRPYSLPGKALLPARCPRAAPRTPDTSSFLIHTFWVFVAPAGHKHKGGWTK